MLNDLLFRLRALVQRRRVDDELDEELQFHLEHEAAKYAAGGGSKGEAARRARLAFGGPAQVAEACRDARGIVWLEMIWKDICYALRSVRTRPLFGLTVVASLALGIGANTAIFTLLRVSLWKPLSIEKPREIFHLQRVNPNRPMDTAFSFSYVLFEQLTRAAQPFGEVAAKSQFERIKFGTGNDSREHAVGEAVSANFFSTLKVRPYAGRVFETDDDSLLGGRHVAVFSYRFWKNRFQFDHSILGRTILYNETPYTVVGIAQPDFDGVEAEAEVDVWVPLTTQVRDGWLTDSNVHWLRLLTRLRAKAVPGQAEAALDETFRAHLMRELVPGLDAHWKPLIEPQHLRLRPAGAGLSTTGHQYERPLYILMTAVAFVLLICCANVANIALARNRARETEIAMRRTLGASRTRIVQQLFTEALLLSLFGAGLGVILASWTCRLLISLLPHSEVPLAYNVRPDFAVLGFALAIGIGTAVLFGLLPAVRVSATEDALYVGSGTRVTGRSFAGKLLVVGQLAFSLLLLIGAGLFVDTVRNLKAANLGFRPEQVLTFDLSFPKGTPKEHLKQTYEQVREKLQESPGVVAASYVWPDVYGEGGWSSGNVEAEDQSASHGEDNEVGLIAAGPDFFQTIGLGLLQGRYLTSRDLTGALPVAVVNESLATHYFGKVSPIGRRLKFPGNPATTREIVGVVRNAKHYGVREKAWRMVYVPDFQEADDLLLRTSAGFHAQSSVILDAVSSVDAMAQVERIGTLESSVDELASGERMIAALSAVFSGLALLLASVGLYGVMAYSVARRTAELGIRIALGAQRMDVQLMVLRESVWLVAGGTLIGVALALALTQFVSTILYGVQPRDTGIFLDAVLVLAVVGLVAGLVPAWRASRVDPISALRFE